MNADHVQITVAVSKLVHNGTLMSGLLSVNAIKLSHTSHDEQQGSIQVVLAKICPGMTHS